MAEHTHLVKQSSSMVRSDPRDVADIITLSKKTYSKMVQNLIWATGYNSIAIPLAAGVAVSYGSS
jgi:Cu2+-exporting ATPase